MTRSTRDAATDPVVVSTNTDEDCSPGALSAFIDELLAGPEPPLDSIGAADAMRELRSDADA